MTDQQDIIFSTDPRSATYRTDIKGWVSRGGFFCGENEQQARQLGATHRACKDCGNPIEVTRLICTQCQVSRTRRAFLAMPAVEWDGQGMVYSIYQYKYFGSWDEVETFAENMEICLRDLMLVICEPVWLHNIDDDEWADDLGEDGEMPYGVVAALQELAVAIKLAGPVSYMPGSKAVMLPAAPCPHCGSDVCLGEFTGVDC